MRLFIGATALALMLSAATAASAGIYTDDMSRCLVKSASDADKTVLIQWIFGEISLNAAVKPIVTMSADQRKDMEKKGAQLFQRLLLEDCRKETTAALKYEGSTALEASFGVLGQVAMRGLMADPAVTAGVQNMTAYLDKDRWAAMAKESGVPLAAAK